MQLNIKNGEAYRLATELAQLTGESLTEVVTKALAERLAQEKRERTDHPGAPEAKLAQTLATIRALQERVRAIRKPEDMITEDDLYDENGLPR
jgi:antitoxin VapB